MDELTLGAEHPSYCCCCHHSCFIFCLQSWTDQFKKNQFSLVSRQLFLNFWMDYASFIFFCNRFNSNLIIGQHSTGVENSISQTLWSLDTFPLKTYWGLQRVFHLCGLNLLLMFLLLNTHISKRQRNKRLNCQHLLDHRESKGVPEKHLLLLHWLH